MRALSQEEQELLVTMSVGRVMRAMLELSDRVQWWGLTGHQEKEIERLERQLQLMRKCYAKQH